MEAIFQQLEMHMTFICPECGETFELQQQWRQHLNFHHDYLCKTPEDFGFAEINDRYHECLECNQLVADGKRAIALLQYHRFVHLPYKCTYRCRHCFGTFMRKRVCFNHLCRVHESIVGKKLAVAAMKTPMLANRKESLTKLPTTTNTFSAIARHNPEFYLRCICPQCGYELTRTEDWLKHIETAHKQSLLADYAFQQIIGTEDFYCTICEKVLYTNDSEKHQRHYFMHLPYKLNFRCAYCKVKRPFKTEILHHFMTTHLLVFERQRIYMRKPKEFGHDVNRKLDRELDLLLKYGNTVGAPNGSVWPKFSSTSTAVAAANQRQRILTPAAKKAPTDQKDIIQTGIVSSIADLAAAPKENINRTTNIKKELDALCAEIFKDIENDEISSAHSVIEPANANLLTDANSLMQACSMEHLVSSGESNFSSNSNNGNVKVMDEEVVSIEIDTLDENELDDLNENVETSPMTELYENLKELYNAKVLHLCPQCGIAFAEQAKWRDHVLKSHENLCLSVEKNFRLLDDQTNLCLTCNNVLHTTTRTELQRHQFTHMPYSAYLKCTLCQKCELSKPHMLEHLENSHGEFLKTVHELNYKANPPKQIKNTLKNFEIKNENGNAEQIPKVETTFQTSTENADYISLITHLKNARARLNRMAAEYGIENK